ncbi:MAG: hypothetical protein R8L53_02735 [Mariprofundales bacterium]
MMIDKRLYTCRMIILIGYAIIFVIIILWGMMQIFSFIDSDLRENIYNEYTASLNVLVAFKSGNYPNQQFRLRIDDFHNSITQDLIVDSTVILHIALEQYDEKRVNYDFYNLLLQFIIALLSCAVIMFMIIIQRKLKIEPQSLLTNTDHHIISFVSIASLFTIFIVANYEGIQHIMQYNDLLSQRNEIIIDSRNLELFLSSRDNSVANEEYYKKASMHIKNTYYISAINEKLFFYINWTFIIAQVAGFIILIIALMNIKRRLHKEIIE